MNQYGIFSGGIAELDHSLTQVRTVWTDKTAQTYNCINENMEDIACKIWSCHQSAAAGEQAVRENYREEEFDAVLHNLGSRIGQL